MSTAPCANRPPQSSQPGLNRGPPNPQPNTATGAPNPLPQGPQHVFPGMYTSQDYHPGPPCTSHPPTHFPPPPFMYIPPATHPHPQPPPMPPFLQYQWPMPYSYNPFPGFPAMGYGMGMPPNYIPGYMLPQPHPQQVNYRRLIHTQFPAASTPYQSQNQNRVFHAQPNVSAVRETINSEVQTEPTGTENGYADGSLLVGSESGIVTNSSSATLSDSSREKQSHAAMENYTTAASDLEGNLVGKMGSSEGTVKHGSTNLSTKPDATQSQTRTPFAAQNGKKVRSDQDSGSFRHASDGSTNTLSTCSSDGVVPVCSSSNREDEVCPKLRQPSYSDTFTGWVGGVQPLLTSELPDHSLPRRREKLPSAKDAGVDGRTIVRRMVAPRRSEEMSYEHEVDLIFSPTASEALRKLLQLPFYSRGTPSGSTTVTDPAVLVGSIVADIHSRNGMSQCTPVHSPSQSQEVPDNELLQDNEGECSLHEAADIMQESASYLQYKRKTYESVWCAESLPPYDPKDWLTRSDLMIGDLLEDSQNDVPAVPSQERGLSHRFSMTAESPPSQCRLPICLADQLHFNLSHTVPLTTQQDVDTSTPTETFNPRICEMGVQTPLSNEKQLQSDQCMDPSNALATSILREVNIHKTTLAVGEGMDIDGSSEPEAVPSPNQKPRRVTKWSGIGPCSSEQVEAPLSNSLTEKSGPSSSPKSLQIREREQELNGKVVTSFNTNEQLAIGIKTHFAVSPSKAHMVDCGIQCTVIQDCCRLCKGHNMGGNKRSTLARSGRANEANAAVELCENPQPLRNLGSGITGSKAVVRQHRSKKSYSWRNRPTAWWEETWTGYDDRPGKSKGGTGRNSRY